MDFHESEANNFAVQLLVPKAFILKERKKLLNSYKERTFEEKIPVATFIEGMADKFEVSSKAMEYRLRRLQIIK